MSVENVETRTRRRRARRDHAEKLAAYRLTPPGHERAPEPVRCRRCGARVMFTPCLACTIDVQRAAARAAARVEESHAPEKRGLR